MLIHLRHRDRHGVTMCRSAAGTTTGSRHDDAIERRGAFGDIRVATGINKGRVMRRIGSSAVAISGAEATGDAEHRDCAHDDIAEDRGADENLTVAAHGHDLRKKGRRHKEALR